MNVVITSYPNVSLNVVTTFLRVHKKTLTQRQSRRCLDVRRTLTQRCYNVIVLAGSRVIRSVWFNREAQPEKHYRELLMLFTPWRNKETELISHHTSFQEHYLARCDEIGEQMKQYAVCSEDLDEIQQHFNDNEDQFDSIAPVTQNTELQDEDEGNQDLHPDLNEQYDISEDIGIPSTAQNNEPLILNEMQDDEYRGLVQSLNKKQKEFFQHALHFIKTSDNPFYAFLSGGGEQLGILYGACAKFSAQSLGRGSEIQYGGV